MDNDETLYLLVIDDSSNLAENVATILRNGGHAVRSDRIADAEALRHTFGRQQWDMILSKPRGGGLSAAEALELVRQSEFDIPLLLIGDDAEEGEIEALIDAGAHEPVYLSKPRRLELAILREADAVRTRRALALTMTALQQANERAQGLVDSSRDAITYVYEGMHLFANDAYLQLFGYQRMEEIEGLPIMDVVSSDEHAHFREFLRDYVQGNSRQSKLSVTGIRTDGCRFGVEMEFSPAYFAGVSCSQIIIRDQGTDQELQQRLNDISRKDLLTGAFNRPHFLHVLQELCGKPDKEGVVLSLLPDEYQRIRDDKGIAAGDVLLARFAEYLAATLPREEDFVTRFEGEQFMLLLHDTSPEAAEDYARELATGLVGHIFDIDGTTTTTSCSIGIGAYNEALSDHLEVIRRSEKALRQAIEAGGNRVQRYVVNEAEMGLRERHALIARQIKLALAHNHFHILFQPIVSLKGDSRENYEVFARMRDEHGTELTPAEFIPAAEAAGLMGAIDRWMLGHAIKAVTEKRHGGNPAVVFAKLSASSLADEGLLPWLQELLKSSHAEADSLVLCIDEDIANDNLKELKQLQAGLEPLHVALALDHFGSARNYLNLLVHIDAAYLKLSASFVGKLSSDVETQKKVGEITALAAQSQRKVIANGVEDPHTLATIYSTGVDYIQGYFLQEPRPTMDYDFSSI